MREHPHLNMSSIQQSRFNDITFDRLLRLQGVNGGILSEAGRLVLSQTKLAEAQAAQLARLARGLCRGYRKVGRVPTTVLMAYQKCALLLLSRDDAQLVLLLETAVDIDSINAAATAYLNKRMQRPLRLPAAKQQPAA
jgi:hypothetical protein